VVLSAAKAVDDLVRRTALATAYGTGMGSTVWALLWLQER
jgi:hypothetical protein